MEKGTYSQRQALKYLKAYTMKLKPEISDKLRSTGLYLTARRAAEAAIKDAETLERVTFQAIDNALRKPPLNEPPVHKGITKAKLLITTGINASYSRSMDVFVLSSMGAWTYKGSPLKWNDIDTTGLSLDELRAVLYIISLSMIEKQRKIHLFQRALKVGTAIALTLTALVLILSHVPIWPF